MVAVVSAPIVPIVVSVDIVEVVSDIIVEVESVVVVVSVFFESQAVAKAATANRKKADFVKFFMAVNVLGVKNQLMSPVNTPVADR